MEPVEIAAGRLQLRPWHAGDLEVARAALTDFEIDRWRSFGRHAGRPVDDDVARAWLEEHIGGWDTGAQAAFAVMDATTGEVYGSVKLDGIDETQGQAWIGYWLLPAGRGRGIATQAVGTVTRWAFGALGLHRVQLSHPVGNARSCEVAARTGFTLEGVTRGSCRLRDGTYHDEHLHARLAVDPGPGA